MNSLADRLRPGLAGRYEIEREIGRGGMGTVFLAHDLKHPGKQVAIKVLTPEVGQAMGEGRFLIEIKTLSLLTHPHILPLLDSGETEGLSYLVTPYLGDDSLRNLLNTERRLPVDDALRIAREVASALDYAHRRGVIHRDVKPENVLLVDGQAIVADFGIARRSQATTVTEPNTTMGTPAYMSPEQVQDAKSVDGRSDLYSLACVLFEMLAGQPPFGGPDAQSVLSQHLAVDAPSVAAFRPAVPPQVTAVLRRALAKHPADRFATCAAFAAALADRGVAEHPAEMGRPGGSRPAWRTARKVGAVAIVAAGLTTATWWVTRSITAPKIRSLAVLPFENLSGDPDQQYLADGVGEALRAELASIPSLRVLPRGSVERFRDVKKPPRVAGEELGVDAVLEGSALRSGGRVRVTAELVETRTERHLWAHTYERFLEDILVLQGEVVRDLAKRCGKAMTEPQQARGAGRRRVKADAYDAYLRGEFYYQYRRTKDGLTQAAASFQRAIDDEPEFAPAHAALAKCLVLMANWGHLAPEEARPRARAAAARAVALDSTDANSYVALAKVMQNYEWDWGRREGLLRRAIDLNPHDSDARHEYANLLSCLGRHDDAIEQIRTALALDPLSPKVNDHVGWFLYLARRYDEAIEYSRKALELDPNFFEGHWSLAAYYVQKRMHDVAETEFRRVLAEEDSLPELLADLGYLYGRTGRKSEALSVLEWLRTRAATEVVVPYDIAIVYAGLGLDDQAIEWLDRAVDQRSGWVEYMKVDPRLDPIRAHPRYPGLLKRIALD